MSDMHNAPETIWLQVDPNGEDPTDWFLPEGATWCKDKVNGSDVEYVRADVVESLRQQLADTETLLNEMRDEASTYRVQANNLEQQLAEIRQAISDPENQPSQYGTVTLEHHEQAMEPPTGYAKQLAISLHAKLYSEVTQWEPCDDLMGLLTQIDNMLTGIEPAICQAKREALLEAADRLESYEYIKTQPAIPYAEAYELRRMAKELE